MWKMEDKIDTKQWYSFPKLSTAEQLNEYFEHLNKKGKKYYHYTSLGAVDAILRDKQFVISNVQRFNDKIDAKQFGDENEQKRFFSLCFSRGTEENLSLWYMYSGVDGKGGRLCFTYDKIQKLISDKLDNGELRFSLYEYDYKNHKIIGEKIRDLHNGLDCEIKLHDVLYYKFEEKGGEKKARLKFNTMTNNGAIDVAQFEKYKNDNCGFNKSLIWFYEKEERLLIEIKQEVKIDPDEQYVVICKLDDIIKHAKITTAPEINDKEELKEYTSICSFIFDSSSVNLSEHHGDIEMKICDKCEYKNYKTTFCPKCDKDKVGVKTENDTQ